MQSAANHKAAAASGPLVTGDDAQEMARLTAKATHLIGELTRSSAGIQSVAREIQLLAVNAGVEAARHGAAGRGFAVIAEAVKKLADQTRASTVATGRSLSGLADTIEALRRQDEAARAAAGGGVQPAPAKVLP